MIIIIIIWPMTKVIANRLKKVLNLVIDECQSAFISDRSISYNMIIGHETLHFLKSKKKGKLGYVALKLDMSKAYDRVEWTYIVAVMDKLGFPRMLTDLIMDCISSASFSIMVNGEARGNFRSTKGLRQGDPLSPYLFPLCSKGISSMLNSARNGDIAGVSVAKSAPKVSHLFFANDSLVLLKAKAAEFGCFKVIMSDYERASGQCINLDKSTIRFSKNVQGDTRSYLASILQMRVVDNLGPYLGFPSAFHKGKGRDFQSVMDKICRNCRVGSKVSFQ